MLRAGVMVLLSLNGCWLLVTAIFLVSMLTTDWIAPHLFSALPVGEILSLSQEMHAATRYLSIICYTFAVGYYFLILLTIWKDLTKGHKWAFWAIVVAMGLTHVMWFAADAAIGNRAVAGNVILSVLALAGILLSGYGLSKQQNAQTE